MNISPISANIVNILSSDQISFGETGITSGITEAASVSFSDILSGSMKTAAEADAMDKYSAIELLTGQSDDLSGLLLDAQKAELSLNLALQIRNKVLDAYNEIMRMQV